MAHTVKTFDVKFAKGKNQTVERGKADYAMSYVYRVRAKKDQVMTVSSFSTERELRFSIFGAADAELKHGYAVKTWTGKLKESGVYQIVLVMSDEHKRKVPYRLKIKIE